MALKTLKGVESIARISPDEYAAELKKGKFICVNHGVNSISFTVQDGPVKEGGVNGCQVDAILETVGRMVEGLNKPPLNCMENEKVIYHIKEAMRWLDARRRNREKAGTEGTSKS